MSLVQTVNLEKVVDDSVSPAIISRWVAAHNPVYLEWIRKDYIITGINIVGGFLQFQTSLTSYSDIDIDDELYLDVTTFKGIVTVTGKTAPDLITTDLAIPSYSAVDPYANNITNKKNYYVEIKLTDSAGTTELALLQATPDTTGKIGIDISGALQSYLSNDDNAPLTSWTYYKDVDSFVAFRYDIDAYWTGNSDTDYTASDVHYAVNGAFQNLHEFNGNYAEYIPTTSSFLTYKWLLDFTLPSVSAFTQVGVNAPIINYYVGYPSDISFLYADNMDTSISNNLRFYVLALDSNFTNIGFDQITFPDSNVNSIIRINPYVNIDPNQKYLLIYGYDDNGDQFTTLTLIKLIDTSEICGGVYLEWLGEKGNRSYFLFNDKYNESLLVEGGQTYQKAFDAIDDLTERANWYEKKPFKKLTVGADNLERYEIEGLKTLLKSTRVYEVMPDGKKQGVLLEPGTFNIGRGDDNKFKIEFSIVYPEQFNQTA